jgi:hypothetical protein
MNAIWYVTVSFKKSIKLLAVNGFYHKVPQCMSPRRNWDSPNPSLASECAPQGADHLPLPLRVANTGRNHLNEELTSLLPTGIGERF